MDNINFFVRGINTDDRPLRCTLHRPVFMASVSRSGRKGATNAKSCIFWLCPLREMYLFIRVTTVEVCDARDDDSSTSVGKINYFAATLSIIFVVENPSRIELITTRPPLAITSLAPAICSTV